GDVKKYRCAYDKTIIEKVFSKKFAASGSPAYAAMKKFTWSNSDQETVAKWIAGDHVKPEKAGEKWVNENAAKVKKWFGKWRRPTRASRSEREQRDARRDQHRSGKPCRADPLAQHGAGEKRRGPHARLPHRGDGRGRRA